MSATALTLLLFCGAPAVVAGLDSFFVASCDDCPTFAPARQIVNATCLESSQLANAFECSCQRPFMKNWFVTPNGTIEGEDGGPRCLHAFDYPGTLVINYMSSVLVFFGLVYTIMILHHKIRTSRQSEDADDRVKSRACNPMLISLAMLLFYFLSRIMYTAFDPMSYYGVIPAIANDFALRLGFQAVLIAVFIVLDRYAMKP